VKGWGEWILAVLLFVGIYLLGYAAGRGDLKTSLLIEGYRVEKHVAAQQGCGRWTVTLLERPGGQEGAR
jgi:hypothetical protein